MVTSPSQVLINGKMPGTISLFVWDRAGVLKRYEVVVQRDLARLGEQLTQLFPGEGITAQSNGKAVVLSGLGAPLVGRLLDAKVTRPLITGGSLLGVVATLLWSRADAVVAY